MKNKINTFGVDPNRRFSEFSKNEIALIGIGIIGFATLLIKYSGIPGDMSAFPIAGKYIWGHENPYSHSSYANSPVSAVILYGFQRIFPFALAPAIIQILNIIGLFTFLKIFFNASDKKQLIPLFAFIPFMSPTRALFGNVQVTGLVLGLVACGYFLIHSKNRIFYGIFSYWWAFELKPQFALPFLIIIIFQNSFHFKRFIYFCILFTSTHLFLSLQYGGSLDLLWLRRVIEYSKNSMLSGYEISGWKALGWITNSPEIFQIGSVVTVLVILTVVVIKSRIGDLNRALALAIVFPLATTYIHSYDLIVIGCCIFLYFAKNRNLANFIPVTLFLQVFPLQHKLVILSACLSLLLASLFLKDKLVRSQIPIYLSIILVQSLIYLFPFGDTEETQTAIFLTLPTLIFGLVSASKGLKHFRPIDSTHF